MKMDLVMNRAIGCLVFLLATNQSVAERMNKCVDEKGNVTFTKTDCPKNEARHRVFVAPPKRGTGAGLRDSELRAIGDAGKNVRPEVQLRRMNDQKNSEARQELIDLLSSRLREGKLYGAGARVLSQLLENKVDEETRDSENPVKPSELIDPSTGTVMPRVEGGYIDSRTGTFYYDAHEGVVNTRTGEFSHID